MHVLAAFHVEGWIGQASNIKMLYYISCLNIALHIDVGGKGSETRLVNEPYSSRSTVDVLANPR